MSGAEISPKRERRPRIMMIPEGHEFWDYVNHKRTREVDEKAALVAEVAAKEKELSYWKDRYSEILNDNLETTETSNLREFLMLEADRVAIDAREHLQLCHDHLNDAYKLLGALDAKIKKHKK